MCLNGCLSLEHSPSSSSSEWPNLLNDLQVIEHSTSFPVSVSTCVSAGLFQKSIQLMRHNIKPSVFVLPTIVYAPGRFNKWPLPLICVLHHIPTFSGARLAKFASEATAANHTLWAQQISQWHKWGLIQEEVKKTCYHGSSHLMTAAVSVPCNTFHVFLNYKTPGG